MAESNRVGSGGENASGFRLSQPRGVVTTISSKEKTSPDEVAASTLESPDDNMTTLVDSFRDAPSRAGLAMDAKILVYVPPTNRFSSDQLAGITRGEREAYIPPSIHSSSQRNFRLWFWTLVPT